MSTLEQVKPAPVRSSEGGGGVRGWYDNSRNFLTEVRNEMRRVTWPSKKEVYATTLVVILFSVVMGLYLFVVDLALDRLIRWLYRTLGA
jgi:preprotein translocase subunit SecE